MRPSTREKPSVPASERVRITATVTKVKGFARYRAKAEFNGDLTWKLGKILQRLGHELKVDEEACAWTVWNKKKSVWEKVKNTEQLLGKKGAKLRLYRVKTTCIKKASPEMAAALYLFFSGNPWFYDSASTDM